MKNFDAEQKTILESSKKVQLVSAGAGSGKTTVMIEKISNLLNSGVDIDNLLVVTFTVLAASEMKDRLIKNLNDQLETATDKEKILKIIDKIKTASIDTIDGFSSKTIKKYFYELEISPNIEIITDSSKDYYQTLAMKKTIEDFSKDVENSIVLLDIFGGNKRNFEPIKEMILEIYNHIINIKDYQKFLDDSLNEYLDGVKSEDIINKHICRLVDNAKQDIIEEYSLFDEQVQGKLQNIIERLEKFNINLSFSYNLNLILNYESEKFSLKEYKENEGLKQLKNKISVVNELKENFIENDINENFSLKNSEIYEYFGVFLKILKNFIKNYENLKQKNNLIDFNDLNRLMLKLLENEKIKLELQNKYTHIFVDEYQDVNPLQDELISGLINSKTKVFFVGDVKQSIYGFRGASPDLFISKYNNLKQSNQDEKAFDMNINFRSNPMILEFINDVFIKLMNVKTTGINYSKDAVIKPKREDIVDEKVKIYLIEENKQSQVEKGIYSVKNHINKKTFSNVEKQSFLVLDKITKLIGTEFYDANTKQKRMLEYKDIAILIRSEKDEGVKTLTRILKEHGVPLNINNKLEVEESECLKLIISILKCVNLTADDVDYLASIMALTNLSIDQVTSIRDKNVSFYENLINSDNVYVKRFFKIIEDIKNQSYSKTNTELIRYIYNDIGLKYYILQNEFGEKELLLMEEFLNKLSPVEDALNLTEFIEMVQTSVNGGGDFSTADGENCVNIQTIHKSKGLEYPVVILFNANKTFNYLKDKETINFNKDVGLGVDYYDRANRIKTNSLTKMAIKLKNNFKGYTEELRLLYVALTRAKNKLYIFANVSPKIFTDGINNKNSFINMILSCFISNYNADKQEYNHCIIETIREVNIVNPYSKKASVELKNIGENFVYPNENKFNIPVKNSVTNIVKEININEKYLTKKVLNPFVQYQNEDVALIGTHYHKALEKMNFNKSYCQNTKFTDVDYSKIKKAHQILQKLINGAKTKKEAQFLMYIPYNELVNSEIEDKVLVQGVVDLIIIRENSIDIVDYKFSTLAIDELKEKYQDQLRLYKIAVEKAFNLPVAHMYIYSIQTGELG